MALYEYACTKCGNADLHASHDGPPKENPECVLCGAPTDRVYGFGTTNMPTSGGRKMGRK